MLRHFNNKKYWGSSSASPRSQKVFFVVVFCFIKRKAGMCVHSCRRGAMQHTLPAPQLSATAASWYSSGEPRVATRQCFNPVPLPVKGGEGLAGSDSSAVGSPGRLLLQCHVKGRSFLLIEMGPNPC